MQRRNLTKLGVLGTLTSLFGESAMAAKPAPIEAPLAAPFDIVEATVAQLQAAMQAGQLSSKRLVQLYLARIAAIDKAGPKLNSVIELNPDAVQIAVALDDERKRKGPRGPLHGIPVLIKDNIATADRMQTTAGSLALVGARSPKDAHVVARLRDAGAVILGKTNLRMPSPRSRHSPPGCSRPSAWTRCRSRCMPDMPPRPA